MWESVNSSAIKNYAHTFCKLLGGYEDSAHRTVWDKERDRERLWWLIECHGIGIYKYSIII